MVINNYDNIHRGNSSFPIKSSQEHLYDKGTHDPLIWVDAKKVDLKTTLHFPDGVNDVITIGDDFTISARDFKICLKMLLEQAKKEMPEEFI